MTEKNSVPEDDRTVLPYSDETEHPFPLPADLLENNLLTFEQLTDILKADDRPKDFTDAMVRIDFVLDHPEIQKGQIIKYEIYMWLLQEIRKLGTEPFASLSKLEKNIHVLGLLKIRAHKTKISRYHSGQDVETDIDELITGLTKYIGDPVLEFVLPD